MSGSWRRLIRFIPKKEKVIHYGELINDTGIDSPYTLREFDGLKARVFSMKRIDDDSAIDTGVVKDVEEIVAPLVKTHMLITPYANYKSSYIVNKVSYPNVFGAKCINMLDMHFGGPKSNLIIPIVSNSTILQVGVHLAVILKAETHGVSEQFIPDKILGYSIGMDITRQENMGYRINAIAASIRDVTNYVVLGPCIVNPSELKDINNLDICLSFDNTIIQAGNTSEFVMDPIKLIKYYSKSFRDMKGAVIFTGTPEPNKLNKLIRLNELKDGKKIVASIENLGFLEVTIRLFPMTVSADHVKIGYSWKKYIKPSSEILSLEYK